MGKHAQDRKVGAVMATVATRPDLTRPDATDAPIPPCVQDVIEGWQRGDVVADDSSNLFCFHPRWGWYGLPSNQCSARGPWARQELADPLTLLIRKDATGTPHAVTFGVQVQSGDGVR